MQRLLRAADWDVEGVCGDVRDFVVEHLSDPGAVLAGDETGFLKKGINPLACNVSTPAPPDARRTVRSACSWPMPPDTGTL
jgi:hypothetical protein